MNPNQNKPLTSFLPASASPPPAAESTPKAGEWDDQLAAEVAAEISPDGAKIGQSRTTQAGQEPSTSPDGAKIGQSRTTDLLPEQDESKETAAESTGAAASPIFRRADDILVAEIAAGTSMREAAKRAGISERTVRRRWTDANFRQRILDARCEIRWEVAGRLTQQMKKATATLMQSMDAKSESVRVSAARAVLKLGQEIGNRAEENALLVDTLGKLQTAMATANASQAT